MHKLSLIDEKRIKGSEALTIATIMAVMAIAVVTIVVWKLYLANKGSVTIPGGFKFEFSAVKNVVAKLISTR